MVSAMKNHRYAIREVLIRNISVVPHLAWLIIILLACHRINQNNITSYPQNYF